MNPASLSIDEILSLSNLHQAVLRLKQHCSSKLYKLNLPLTETESVFYWLSQIGGVIAGDGFISVFHQFFTPESFAKVCEALTEVGGERLRDLLQEAWSIYTKGKHPITLDDLQGISVRRFNTKEKMDRFDQIGEEVANEIAEQYGNGKVWSVEYAKLHRDDFQPIERSTIESLPAKPEPPPRFCAPIQQTPPPLPYLGGRKFSNPLFRQVKHPKDIFAIESEYQLVFALALHNTLKWRELGLTLNPAERSFQLLTTLAGECYDEPVEKWLSDWTAEDLVTVKAALREGGAGRVVGLIEQACHLLKNVPSASEELARISDEFHGACVAEELHKAQVTFARTHQAEFLPV